MRYVKFTILSILDVKLNGIKYIPRLLEASVRIRQRTTTRCENICVKAFGLSVLLERDNVWSYDSVETPPRAIVSSFAGAGHALLST